MQGKDYTKAARALKASGISVVPLRSDGSKLPKIKWKSLQDRYISDKELNFHFKDCGGIAAITGKISRLYCLDFDLKYQFETQDFWLDFTSRIPVEIKKKFLVNKTRSGGRHIWMRTDFEDQSRHYTRRVLTIPELQAKYDELIRENADPIYVTEQLLKNPYNVVIESRSRGSYAVLLHEEYTREYGKKIKEFSVEEIEFLNDVAYSLDYEFIPKKVYTGEISSYSTIRDFNNNAKPEEILDLLLGTGMYTHVSTNRKGDIYILRQGATSKYSGKIFGDNSVLFLHSRNAPLFDTSGDCSFSPFEVFRVCKNLTHDQAVNELTTG